MKMMKYFVMTIGMVSGLALGAGSVLAEMPLKVDGEVGAQVDAGNSATVTGSANLNNGVNMPDNIELEGGVQVASTDLIGTSVYDQNDEHVGEIADIIAPTDGRDTQVIVDVGGFLGLGEHPVAVGIADLSVTTDTEGDIDQVTLLLTKSELEAMPQFES
jgi:PRC-barrel domain